MKSEQIEKIVNRIDSYWGGQFLCGNSEIEYLQKYLLPDSEYLSEWAAIQKNIFDLAAKAPPEPIFKANYELLFQLGGGLFSEEEFASFKDCMLVTHDSHFVVLENMPDLPPRFKFFFPSNITWEEINSGGIVSQELIQRPIRDFFVFGNSGLWGKYSSDQFSLEIIGVIPRYTGVFRQLLGIIGNGYESIRGLLRGGDEIVSFTRNYGLPLLHSEGVSKTQ